MYTSETITWLELLESDGSAFMVLNSRHIESIKKTHDLFVEVIMTSGARHTLKASFDDLRKHIGIKVKE